MTDETLEEKTDRELLRHIIGNPVQYKISEEDGEFRAILESIGENLIRFTHIYRLNIPAGNEYIPCRGEVFENRATIRYIQPIDMPKEDYITKHSEDLAKFSAERKERNRRLEAEAAGEQERK